MVTTCIASPPTLAAWRRLSLGRAGLLVSQAVTPSWTRMHVVQAAPHPLPESACSARYAPFGMLAPRGCESASETTREEGDRHGARAGIRGHGGTR